MVAVWLSPLAHQMEKIKSRVVTAGQLAACVASGNLRLFFKEIMTYQRKTDIPNMGRPKGEPKETLTLRVPLETMERLREQSGKDARLVAVQALRVGLGECKMRARKL